MAPLEPHSMAPRNNSALTKVQLLLMQKRYNSSRSRRTMLQRNHYGSFGASFDCSSKFFCINKSSTFVIAEKVQIFEESSNDAPKEPLCLLWSIIRWLLEIILH